jgi:hypothetical protein
MTLVLFAYPGHFRIMQLAHRHALAAFENVDNIVVVWDDLFETDVDYIGQLETCMPGCQIIYTSNLEQCRDEKDGWLRQQYIKLNLHKFLSGSSWILLDGDTVLRNPRPLIKDDTIIVYGDPWEYYEPYFDFIKHALALDKEDTPSFMSPYWLCERAVLEAIEADSQARHGCNIVAVWKQYQTQCGQCRALSEVELYGLFAVKRMNKKFQFVSHNLKCCLKDEFLQLWYSGTQDLCLGGQDDFPLDFWQQQKIAI